MSIVSKNAPTRSLPSIGELERRISQAVQKLWKQQTGQFPDPAIVLFFERKIVVWLGDVLTPLEKTLLQEHQYSSVERNAADAVMKQHLQHCLREILDECTVESVLIDTDLDQNCTGIVIMLNQLPSVRNADSVPKYKREVTPP